MTEREERMNKRFSVDASSIKITKAQSEQKTAKSDATEEDD
jgi:hypothetical protein